MLERTVTSPAGDEVVIFADADYCDLAGVSAGNGGKARSLALHLDGARLNIVSALWHEGEIVDRKSGRAMAALGERAGVAAATTANMLRTPIMRAGVELDVGAKRTYRAKLVALPDRWYRVLSAEDAVPAATVEVEVEDDGRLSSQDLDGHGPACEGGTDDLEARPPASVEVPLSPLDGLAPVEVELANAVATALLSQVIDIIATGDRAAPQLHKLALDVKGLEERLGTSAEYVDKLRRQLRDVGDELAAVKHERDGLRQRLRATEHNLRVAVGSDAQRIIDIEVRRQVDRVMREVPAGEHAKVGA